MSDKATKRGFDPALAPARPDLRRRPTATACLPRFGDDILGFAPALSFTEAEFEQLFERLKRRSTTCSRSRKCALRWTASRAESSSAPDRALRPRAPAMPEAFKVDRLDLRILAQLQKNGRMTNVDLADAVGLSPSPA